MCAFMYIYYCTVCVLSHPLLQRFPHTVCNNSCLIWCDALYLNWIPLQIKEYFCRIARPKDRPKTIPIAKTFANTLVYIW